MPLADLQKRASQIGVNGSKELQAPLKFLTRDVQETAFPDLSTIGGQKQIESLIRDDIKLVILDNISILC